MHILTEIHQTQNYQLEEKQCRNLSHVKINFASEEVHIVTERQ